MGAQCGHHWRSNWAATGAAPTARAELTGWEGLLDTQAEIAAKALAHWRNDPDLAPVRDADDLSDEFRQLWTDVDQLLEKARSR